MTEKLLTGTLSLNTKNTNLTWSETPKTGFLVMKCIYFQEDQVGCKIWVADGGEVATTGAGRRKATDRHGAPQGVGEETGIDIILTVG